MAVYSVLKPETDILDMLKEYDVKDLIIIVCGGCANESLAYFRREPIFKSTNNRRLCDSFADGDAIPFASVSAGEQIKTFLSSHGYNVKMVVIPAGDNSLCIREKSTSLFCHGEGNYDLVLAMCCPAGIVGIRQEFNNIPVFPLMKPVGQLYYKYVDSDCSREMIYDECVIIEYS